MTFPSPEPVEPDLPGAPDAHSDDAPPLDQLLRRLAVSLVVLIAVVVVLGVTVREPLSRVSEAFVDQFGITGVLVGCMIVDAIPGLTHEPLLLFGWEGGLGYWSIFAAAGTGSMLAGFVGFGIGRLLGRAGWVHRMLHRYRVIAFLHRYGTTAIAVAALTPFPFAIATWGAGAAGIGLRPVLLGALFRYPKVLFYLSLIAVGWQASG